MNYGLIQYVHYPLYTAFYRSATIAVLNIYQKCFNSSSCRNESSLSLRGRSWLIELHFFLHCFIHVHLHAVPNFLFLRTFYTQHNYFIFIFLHCFIQVRAVPSSGWFLRTLQTKHNNTIFFFLRCFYLTVVRNVTPRVQYSVRKDKKG